MVELGSFVKDKITGLEGIVMGRTEYLTNCAHIGVCPQKVKENGELQEWQWMDERRVTVLKKKPISFKPILENPIMRQAGGPQSNAPSM